MLRSLKSIKILVNARHLVYIYFRNIKGLGVFPPGYTNLKNFFRYLKTMRLFRSSGGKISAYFPIVNEHSQNAGVAGGHYFHQDLLIAQFIQQNSPRRHIDVGSRIDGFVAHVASFRTIEILDIRDIKNGEHENIIYKRSDLMELQSEKPMTDSLSCLHTIEHFGLGRYGDPINPNGHLVGFNNLINMLETNGTLYISFPIGKKTEVHFNAHRIFHPLDILNWAPGKVELIRFDYVDDSGRLHKNFELSGQMQELNYGCGIYTFKKI
jgi:hypothetical protein